MVGILLLLLLVALVAAFIFKPQSGSNKPPPRQHSPTDRKPIRQTTQYESPADADAPPHAPPASAKTANLNPPQKRKDHAPPPPIPASRQIRGRAHVIDGDTIAIERIKIRLAGIDAPELDQPWGQKSKWAMVGLCKGQTIRVELTGETSYDRLVGTCYLPDGRDIGAEIIKQGLALDGGYYSKGKYRHLEPDGVRQKLKFYGRWR